MIFVAGMGLMARMGIGHGEGSWPGWIIAKMALWLALAISTPVLSKRLPPTQKAKVFWLLMAVFIGIVYLVTYQPLLIALPTLAPTPQKHHQPVEAAGLHPTNPWSHNFPPPRASWLILFSLPPSCAA